MRGRRCALSSRMSVGVPRIPPAVVEAVAKEAKRERRGDAWRPRIASGLTALAAAWAVVALCVLPVRDATFLGGLCALVLSVAAVVAAFVTTWQASRVRHLHTSELFCVTLCALWFAMGVG